MTLNKVEDIHEREAEIRLLTSISQIRNLFSPHVSFPLNFNGDRKGFSGAILDKEKYTEILSLNARLAEEHTLLVEIGIARIDD